MILPKGKALYENLNTSFTNFGELLLNLRSNSFTGYVSVSFWTYSGTLFMDKGNLVNAVEDAEGKVTTGQQAVSHITGRVKEGNGTISVFNLPTEMITMLSSVVKNQVVHKDLTTEFTSLDKLIEKLQNEQHTGYVEVTMDGDKGVGIIFLQSGDPIESIFSNNGDAGSGVNMLSRIVDTASSTGATFNVFKAAIDESFRESEAIIAGFELPQLLEVWGATLSTAEKVADAVANKGDFSNGLKDSMIQKAGDYPFLDPFKSAFKYQDGVASFDGSSLKEFNEGLADCLNLTISKLSEESGENLQPKIKNELQAVKKKHAEAIAQFALDTLLPDYFG